MMPLGSDEDDADVMVDINTTPLVDVLLVLLVMLIITIPIQLHSINLEMPSVNAPQPPVPPTIVQLDVTPAGAFMWNGEPFGINSTCAPAAFASCAADACQASSQMIMPYLTPSSAKTNGVVAAAK